MRNLSLLFVCTLCVLIHAEDLKSFYQEYGVFPDIYDEGDIYLNNLINATLLSCGVNGRLINGKEYAPATLYETPVIEPPLNHDPNSFYTLVYICPDWFTRDFPNLRHFLMWMVTNIPGSDFTKGDTIVEYSPPGPLKMAKVPTRYFFALYKQPVNKITVEEPYTESREPGIRPQWSIKNFVAKHNLGTPIAILGIETSFDKTVPQLHKEYMSFKKST